MTINPPTPQDVKEIAAECGISLNDTLSEGYLAFMSSIFGQLNELPDAPEGLPPVKYRRGGGWVPPREENQLNAWYVRCSIKGAARGKLKGRTVAIKDNIMVAGVPMMNGTALLEGYVPEIDATVVTRLLDAGARLSARRSARISACPAAATPAPMGPSTIRTAWTTRQAARPRAAPHWSAPAKWTWRSAATRAGRSACPHRSAAPTA